ncbi:MAG: ribosome recycling factor [Christensenella sp.]|uniref:ribosome recycling factor n=1 Tax=Christensenella sp. TaxID=1935934 RepID=UPI002B1F0137|nr:ribosome recycling factor [Christensenella sp.]MEA5002068.1 ribosome recycling factor [Christensenella sp.]
MEHEALKTADEKMEKTLNVLRKELVSIRAGRANAQLLDGIMVDYYGTPTPISQVGNISAPEPRLLVISLWDTNILHEVEKAIQTSDLGINPANDGKLIRLAFPEVTGEKRQELVKLAKKKAEESKIAIRAIRRDANELLKKEKKASELSEDDLEMLEKDVQDLTDKKIKKVDEILQAKEQEILEI